MHPEAWDSRAFKRLLILWNLSVHVNFYETWHSSFFFLQQESIPGEVKHTMQFDRQSLAPAILRADSCFSEAFFCGTRKDHAKRSLANHARQSLANHAKLSLRNPPGRCESQSEIYHPPSTLWWLCQQKKRIDKLYECFKSLETSGLFQKGQSWEFDIPTNRSSFQHWIHIAHDFWILLNPGPVEVSPTSSQSFSMGLRMEDHAGMCHTSFKQWTWGARGRASRAPKQVAFPILRDFHHTVDERETWKENPVLHHTVINGICVDICTISIGAGIKSLHELEQAGVFFWFAGLEKTRPQMFLKRGQ